MKNITLRPFVTLTFLIFFALFSISTVSIKASQNDGSLPLAGTEVSNPNPRSPEEALAYDAQWYAEYFNVSHEEAIYRLQFQAQIGELNAALREQESDTFAGLWIQNEPDYRIIIAFTANGNEIIQPYLDNAPYKDLVEIRHMPRTLAEIEVVQEKMFNDIVDLGIKATSGIDIINNRIILRVSNLNHLTSSLQNAKIQIPEYPVSASSLV